MDNSYLWLKSLHLLGVVLFLGNIIITGWWKTMADRTRNPVIIAFAQHQVTLTDWIFTVGGVILILAGGLGNALLHDMDYLHTYWLAWGTWLFIASGIIWALILIPVQIAQDKMARQFANGGEIPARYWKLGRLWIVFGILATLLPMINLYWMVFKPV
jgi:uncharacterized membrane protein